LDFDWGWSVSLFDGPGAVVKIQLWSDHVSTGSGPESPRSPRYSLGFAQMSGGSPTLNENTFNQRVS
jgi:hypothetical protein